jgi:putative ABC transport system ATP-binding protein
MAGPTILGRGLTRTFGDGAARATALAGVSLDLYPGELTLLMGPSGSGKTTLLAALSGLLRPTSGQVLALGEDLWSLSDGQRREFRLRHCGFVFQGYNLFPAMSARRQVELVLEWGEGMPAQRARGRAEELLGRLGLADKTARRPAELSGGEKQLVSVARALVKAPALVFADEPTASLDWEHGRQVIEMLRAAARERGATVLVVTHDSRLLDAADRAMSLQDGRLREDGSAPAAGFPSREVDAGGKS